MGRIGTLVVLLLAWMLALGCVQEQDKQASAQIYNQNLVVVSDEPGPASGLHASVLVAEDGDVICSFEAESTGHVELFMGTNGQFMSFRSLLPYNAQPGEVVFDGAALALGLGQGHAVQCVVFPDNADFDPQLADAICPNINTGQRTEPCTRSGIYNFDIIDRDEPPDDEEPPPDDEEPPPDDEEPPPDDEEPPPDDNEPPNDLHYPGDPGDALNGSCGEGGGNGGNSGKVCTPNWRRASGTYNYSFACPDGDFFEVVLVTSSGRTSLSIVDEDGTDYGSSSCLDTVDRIEFIGRGTGTCTATVTAHTISKFKLRIRERKNLPRHPSRGCQETQEQSTVAYSSAKMAAFEGWAVFGRICDDEGLFSCDHTYAAIDGQGITFPQSSRATGGERLFRIELSVAEDINVEDHTEFADCFSYCSDGIYADHMVCHQHTNRAILHTNETLARYDVASYGFFAQIYGTYGLYWTPIHDAVPEDDNISNAVQQCYVTCQQEHPGSLDGSKLDQ